jgi:hypothetical protein
MISDAARYYGSALIRVIESCPGPISIDKVDQKSAGFFILNQRLPVYIKYSTQRRGPWLFTFHREHQQRQQHLFDIYSEIVTILVCGRDGIVALAYVDFRKLLDHVFEEQESISVRRQHNQMYTVSGRDGSLDRRVSRGSLAVVLEKSLNARA